MRVRVRDRGRVPHNTNTHLYGRLGVGQQGEERLEATLLHHAHLPSSRVKVSSRCTSFVLSILIFPLLVSLCAAPHHRSTHTHTYTDPHTLTHTHTQIHTHSHIHIHIPCARRLMTDTFTHTHTRTHTHTHTHTHTPCARRWRTDS